MLTAPSVAPTFAGTVLEQLQADLCEQALELASEGVRCYPSYIGGYIVLANSYLKLGYTDSARIILSEADRRFPNRLVVADMLLAITTAETEAALQITPPLPSPEPMPLEIPEQQSTVTLEPLPESDYVHSEVPSATEDQLVERQHDSYPLRMIELAPPATDARLIRSTAMRLIPGLEYTSLRFEAATRRGGRSIHVLPEPPEFRTFHAPKPGTPGNKSPASLEKLAMRISKVRMEPTDAPQTAVSAPEPQPASTVYTETLATIHMKQGNFALALVMLKAITPKNPEQEERLRLYIAECQKKLGDKGPDQ